MEDSLIPLGLLLFLGLLVFAMIHTSRQQRRTKRKVFREFAIKNGLRYREEDDGTAQEFAKDFDGVGRFRSPSRGRVIPKDVVSGDLSSRRAVLFRHSIHWGEGMAMEWFVAGLTRSEPIAERCSVQFCGRWTGKSTMYLGDPVVKDEKIGRFEVVVRADTPSSAGKMADDRVLKRLAGYAEELSFRPEIQLRGRRVIAYLADRNATVDDLETLEELVEFTEKVASV